MAEHIEPLSVTAEACANIAFIKYWGNRGVGLNLPLNVSISMNLESCVSRTTTMLLPDKDADEFVLNGRQDDAAAAARVSALLDRIREIVGRGEKVRVTSENNFPSGCGIASSASGFAALARAATALFGLDADEAELSRLARLGSGSAARSVLDGFVELLPSETHGAAFARQIAPASAWPDLRDLVVVVSSEEKAASSLNGHALAATSEMMPGRLAAVPARADRVRRAVAERNLTSLGEASELDALSMHAVMMTSRPALQYWKPGTLAVMEAVRALRRGGTEAYFTIDAGPNVHVLVEKKDLSRVERVMHDELGFDTLASMPGPGARIVERSP